MRQIRNAIIQKVSTGCYKLKNCEIKEICGDAEVELWDCYVDLLHGDARVTSMHGAAFIEIMSGNARIEVMRDMCYIEHMRGNAEVTSMRDEAGIGRIGGHSRILEMYDKSIVCTIYQMSHVNRMRDKAHVDTVVNEFGISEMHGESVVMDMLRVESALSVKLFDQAEIFVPLNEDQLDAMAKSLGPSHMNELCQQQVLMRDRIRFRAND